VHVVNVEVHMGDRAAAETMPGQVQPRRAAPQPHIQRPAWPKACSDSTSNPSRAYHSTLARALATCKIGAMPSTAPPDIRDCRHGRLGYRQPTEVRRV